MAYMISVGQMVFARWGNSYYYPALVAEVHDNQIKAAYLDGSVGMVSKEHVLELQEAFETLEFQGNWRHGGFFFKGRIASRDPLIIHYNDGDTEQIELRQLRGKLPKPDKKTASPYADPQTVPARDKEQRLEQLKSLHKAGMLTKEEYKQRKKLLR